MVAAAAAPGVQQQHRRERAANVARTPAARDDNNIDRQIRLTQVQFQELSEEFHAWRAVNNRNIRFCTSRKTMEAFLIYLAGGGYFRQTSLPMGIAISTAWKHCQKAADFFMIYQQSTLVFRHYKKYQI